MIVYIVTREETNVPTAVYSPFACSNKAKALVTTHVNFRVGNGAKHHRSVSYTPGFVVPGTKVRVGGSENHPIERDAADCVNCVIDETEIITENGGRAIYRVTQHPVEE